MPEEIRQNLAETNRGSYYNQDEWLEEFLNDKGAVSDGSESDDSENDDQNYTENIEVVLRRMFFKIGILKNFANFTEKHLYQSFFSILLKTDFNTGFSL